MAARDRRENDIVNDLLGDLEAPIMRLMWERPAATVRDVLELLDAGGRPLAYTTVMTVMSRLAEKGLLTREKIGKSHHYRAATTRERFLQQAATRRIHELIDEFGDLAIAGFLTEVSTLSPERRRRLERLAADGERR